jgi:CheY-like chemotaxis protein
MKAEHAGQSAVSGARLVLVVDDDPQSFGAVVGALEGLNCQTCSCSSGRTALALLSDHSSDLVLLNTAMPGFDAFAATTAIRELHGPGSSVSIVGMTPDPDMIGQVMAAGMDGFLHMPIDPDDLRDLVRRLVRLSPGSGPTPAAPA